MFKGMLKGKFYTKSKSDIKLIRTRIDMILKKRNTMQNYMRNDIAELLKKGLDLNAYGRVDGHLVELNRSSCYEFIEQACLHVLNHLVVMNKQSECPEECKEAVSSLMFAAARFADLPELRELRTLYLESYGDSLNFYANKEFVEKLKSGGRSSKDLRLQLLRDIASEYGLQWNSKDLQNQLCSEPVCEKSPGTKRIDDKCSLQEYSMNDSVKKTNFNDAEYECKTLGEVDALKRVNDFSNYGHEEATRIEDKFPMKREDGESPTVNNDPRMPKKPDEVPPVKDILVDTLASNEKADGSESVKRVVLVVKNCENKPQTLKVEERENIPLEYASAVALTECEVSKRNFHFSEHKHSTLDKQKDDRISLIAKAKPIPKSVRTRRVKPPPIHENTGNKTNHSKESKENAGEGRRILKFLDEGWNNQDDEKMMDELLMHYSKQKGPQKASKWGSDLAPVDSSVATSRSRDGPNRTTSLPCGGPVETPKVHARALSFLEVNKQAHVHVHPKLPEYDDFVARLATLK